MSYEPPHFLHQLVEFGGCSLKICELNHSWHGINVLSVLECALVAVCACLILALFARVVRRSKRLTILSLAGALSFATAAYAANTALSALSASGAIAGANLIYVVQTAGTGGVKATFTQVATFINSLFSGDCTVASGGAVTCTGPTHLSGTAPSLTAGTVTTNANLTGDVTSSGNATTLTNAPVIAKVLTGFTSGAGTVSAADSILSALQKINGNDALKAPIASPTFTGTPAGPTATVGTNTTQLATTAFVIANAGSGTGANPTATAGPTAVNGTAPTFMRSDGAPAVQTATASQLGLVKPDGVTVAVSAGAISVPVGCGLNTSSGTAAVNSNVTARNNTATSDTIASTDCGTTVTESNASAVTAAITVAGLTSGNYFTVKNIGAGTATYTPSSGTINGAATLACKTGQSSDVYYDGTSDLKTLGNTCGLGTASAANTGNSGATLPFLNGTNTFSGTQTFGSVFGTVTTQSGTTYTLAAADCGTQVAFTNAAAITVTIPAALTTGCNIAILQTTSAGQVTVTGTAVSAATLHSAHSYTKTFGQWAIIGINIYTTGVAILTGDGA